MTHLTPDELIDAVEGLLDDLRRAHLASCPDCQRAVADLSSSLGDARLSPVPEPSPLFWSHFSARVRQALDDDATTGPNGGWPALLGWRVLAPLAGLALIVLALIVALPPAAPPVLHVATLDPPIDAGTLTGGADGWQLVAELVSTVDWETATAAGLSVGPGAAELAVFDLSADEQLELRRLLDAELKRPKS
jgi:hypothetical protein